MRLVYRPSLTHDAWLLQWYARLVADRELSDLFAEQYHAASAFLRNFQAPVRLHLDVDPALGPSVIQRAMWFTPFLDGAAVGVYLAPEQRRSRDALQFLVDSVTWGLQQWPVLAAWVRDPRRVKTYQKFGLRLTGSMPKGRAGRTMWLLTVTAEQHAARVERMARHGRSVAAGR